MIREKLLEMGEYAAAGLYEESGRGLFYRKALGLRRYFESCALSVYCGTPLYPSGAMVRSMNVAPQYMRGLSFDSAALREKAPQVVEAMKKEFCNYHSTVPQEHSVAGNMYTHSIPYYERILREGLASYVPRIDKIADADMREGLLHLVEGIRIYAARCVDYLRSVEADEALIAALQRVPMYPARTAYEAIVAWNFVMYLDNCDNLGCLGAGLLPYYRGENMIPWLENLYDNLDANGGYSMALNSECPELAVQCLKAARGRRRPMIELFVDEKTPDEVWQAAFEALRSGGQPAFYSAKPLFEGLKKRFPSIRDEDISCFCGAGCTESTIAGRSAIGSLDAGINLMLIFEKTMREQLCRAESFDAFYEAYMADAAEVTESVMGEIDRSRRERAENNPLPMRTLLIDDCIDRGVDFNGGGARYNWSIINFGGLINLIDSMLALKTLVFDEKRYTAEEVLARLSENDEAFLREVRAVKQSFGRDIAEVNEFAGKISSRIFSMTEKGSVCFGEGFLSASIQFMGQVGAGKRVGATPDGRAAKSPLCDSLAAIFGKDSRGPTALLNSVTALALDKALGTPVLNFNIAPRFPDAILRALILGYMRNGGIQMQITCSTREDLQDALIHPELHNNLIVRVGGYSEYFNNLTDELKQMVIDRSVHDGTSL